MSINPVIPAILCGGSGTRLWPLSRKSFPKQYLSFMSNQDKSMLQETYQRVSKIKNLLDPILVCNEEHRFIAAEQMREINVNPNTILLEPFGRNTGPAITLAALIAIQKADDPILLILSSDHEIKNQNKFIQAIKKGIEYAERGKLVTFGVVPKSPHTGYGYIKSDKPFDLSEIKGNKILEFTEKPSYEKACNFIKDHRYTWNSGIFLFKAKSMLSEMKKYNPEIIEFCKQSLNQSEQDLDFKRLEKEHFKKCPNISFDISVMENTKKGIVLPLDADWNDIGSWESVWETSKKDENNNVLNGNVFLKDSQNCYLRSEQRLIAGIGLKDLVVVETNDAVLISKKNDTQKVKNIVEILKEKGFEASYKHQKIFRPWGHYLSLAGENRWQVKSILVKPGEQLSLQMHHHRSEHWIVVTGTAKVELNSEIKVLSENESIYIPLGSKHRLINPGKIALILIEVQSGSYVGEDDIVRFEDKYGR
tara:strand:- start:6027 stop:7460 length:1434 start_codon:yes stop_codon:yes gene_type:complete